MIIVENRHNEGVRGMYIGRGTIYGNPFKIGDNGMNRKEVVDRYLVWLREEYKKKGVLYDRMGDLARRHKRGETIVLVCSCKPRLCHGDVLKMAIEKIAKTLP